MVANKITFDEEKFVKRPRLCVLIYWIQSHTGVERRLFLHSYLWLAQHTNNVRWIHHKNATRRGSRDSGSNGYIKAGSLFTTPCGTRHQGMHKLRVKNRCLRQKRRSAFILASPPPRSSLLHSVVPLTVTEMRVSTYNNKLRYYIFLNFDYTIENWITFLVFSIDILLRKEIWSFSF